MKYYYLTYNDIPSGVYISQVIDVMYLYHNESIDIRLFAFLSFRDFFKNRSIIKKFCPHAIVVPSFPKLKNWKLNKWILNLFIHGKNNVAIARGVFATNLCLDSRDKFSKIIYDGRGAIAAEQNEYGVYQGTGLENSIEELEKRAVLDSDYRIAVSKKLVKYWVTNYCYIQGKEVVIPCTTKVLCKTKDDNKNYKLLPDLQVDDILLIYSGSLGGWQSFKTLSEILKRLLDTNQLVKVLFLSKEQEEISKLMKLYPGRIYRRWVDPSHVKDYLVLGDYGLLIRENNITNQVASPVKFAEYLIAGLDVIITKEIGDYSDFVKEHQCGLVIDDNMTFSLEKVTKNKKLSNQKLAEGLLLKSSQYIVDKYREIL